MKLVNKNEYSSYDSTTDSGFKDGYKCTEQ
jgi:hypothetical protein